MFINDSLYDIKNYTDIYGNSILKKRINIPFPVLSGKIETGEVLDKISHVYITDSNGVSLYETGIQKDITTSDKFKVNYDTGTIFVFYSREGQTLNLTFSAKCSINYKAKNSTIEDINNNYASTNVEDALKESADRINNLVLNTSNPAEVTDAHLDSVYNLIDITLKQGLDRRTAMIKQLFDIIGNLLSLTTTDKSSVINAINESKSRIDDHMNNINSDRINVMYPPAPLTPAKGDGVTDDTVAIQAALDTGCEVLIPERTFIVQTLTLNSNAKLIGKGFNSILQSKSGYNDSMIKINDFYTTISNLYLKGNVASTSSDGIEFINTSIGYCTIDHVRIEYFGRHGIHGGHIGHVNNVNINECFIQHNNVGIHMQYGVGQINAIWAKHNQIANNNIGIQFFGNNVIIEKNTIQSNATYGISLGDRILDNNKYCFASKISNNYFEQNAKNVPSNASVIAIFSGYDGVTATNRVLRELVIENNYFIESGANYSSLIYAEDLKSTEPSNKHCVFQTYNNYGTLPLLTYNKTSAMGYGCVFDENANQLLPTTLTSSLPWYVRTKGYFDNSYGNIIDVESNANGKYVKYADGRMECYGNIVVNCAINTAWGNLFASTLQTITFPSPFISTPESVVLMSNSSNACLVNGNSATTTTGTFYLNRPTSATAQNYTISYIAKGMWK